MAKSEKRNKAIAEAWATPEKRANMLKSVRAGAAANRGKPKSAETKMKMSLAKLGVPKSEEHKKNMRLSRLKQAAVISIGRAFVMGGATMNYKDGELLKKRSDELERLSKIIPGLAEAPTYHGKYYAVGIWLVNHSEFLFNLYLQQITLTDISEEEVVKYAKAKYAK